MTTTPYTSGVQGGNGKAYDKELVQKLQVAAKVVEERMRGKVRRRDERYG